MQIADMAIADIRLVAVEDIAVAVALCVGRHAEHVAAGLAFGYGNGRQTFPLGDGRKPFPLLAFVAEMDNFRDASCEACTIAPIAPLTREISSMTMVLARCPRPRPPNSLPMVMPIQPWRAISRDRSLSTDREASMADMDLGLRKGPCLIPNLIVALGSETIVDVVTVHPILLTSGAR
nr:hypothetical protein [Mesorhizobium sp.]